MTEKWLEMRLTVPDDAVDLVSQILVDLGSTGIIAADKSLDTFTVPAPETLVNDPTFIIEAAAVNGTPVELLRETITNAPEMQRFHPVRLSLADFAGETDNVTTEPPRRGRVRLRTGRISGGVAHA